VTATSVHAQPISRDQLLEPITAVATSSSLRLQVPPVPKTLTVHPRAMRRTFNNPHR
jgi:hypothetical protein